MKLTIQNNGYSDGQAFCTQYRVDPMDAYGILRHANLTGFDWVGVFLPEFGLDFTARPDGALTILSDAIDKINSKR